MEISVKNKFRRAVKAAYEAVTERQEEINRLNVFPIPDGDTGTNVSLTMANVVKELDKLPEDITMVRIFRAIKRGSLMGARGNSGVITSQILRGIAEGASECSEIDPSSIAHSFEKAREVAYKAVRKPVEGTILTVVKDVAAYATKAAEDGLSTPELFRGMATEAMESVKRTPDLMPTLKENGVVDSGGLAFAVMLEAFVDSFLGVGTVVSKDDEVFKIQGGAKVAIEQVNDWEDHNFRYCTEFLFKSRDLDVEEAYAYLETMGDCQLVVGEHPDFKVHVHTDQPGEVLSWMIQRGQPHEIFIHNMDMQSEERIDKIVADEQSGSAGDSEALGAAGASGASGTVGASGAGAGTAAEGVGFVAVAVGSGNVAILESLGVDKVVSGGQTMNPSTSDIVDAIKAVNAKSVIVLPGNKNIVMSANSAAEIAGKPCAVVPTTSIPQTFTAMIYGNAMLSLEENLEMMTAAIDDVSTCEVTTAVKDAVTEAGVLVSKGDVMGIVDGRIELVGSEFDDVCIRAVDLMTSSSSIDNLTLLAGCDMSDEMLESIADRLEQMYPDLEIEASRGEQPLYPMIIAAE